MNILKKIASSGPQAALLAALLFGAATPLAGMLLKNNSPWMIAALLYLGSGLGLTIYRRISGARQAMPAHAELRWFVGAIACGGLLAPVLLMMGLAGMPV